MVGLQQGQKRAAGPSAARPECRFFSRRYFDFFADLLAAAFGVEGFLPSGFGGWLPFNMAATPLLLGKGTE
jgi:hypothetical protein